MNLNCYWPVNQSNTKFHENSSIRLRHGDGQIQSAQYAAILCVLWKESIVSLYIYAVLSNKIDNVFASGRVRHMLICVSSEFYIIQV